MTGLEIAGLILLIVLVLYLLIRFGILSFLLDVIFSIGGGGSGGSGGSSGGGGFGGGSSGGGGSSDDW